MISLGDRCLTCIINNIHTYTSFASLPSESCESILLLLKNNVALTEDLLIKFGECFISSLDISKEDLLDYSAFMDQFARTSSATTLKSLNVSYSLFNDDDVLLLQGYPLLSNLNFSHCEEITGSTFNIFGALSSLNLRGCTALHGSAIRTIVSTSPSLYALILSKCTQITDSDLEPLEKLNHLQILKLDHCDKITSEGIQHVSRISQLRYFSASHCPELRHADACSALGNLVNLQYLDLSYCNVTDEAFPPTTLKNLSSLVHLEINMNKLSGQFVESISVSLLGLRALELGHSARLGKDDIVCLNRLPRLETMHMSNGRRDRLRISIDETILKSFPIPVPPIISSAEERQLATIPTAIPTSPGDIYKPIVLLGEDEQFQARLVKTVLERKNFIVEIAPDGITAYNMYKENCKRFALVMMDIYLPKMDGLQSIRLMRKFETETKNKHIPVIICSGNPQMKTNQNNYLEESGGDLFIPKPFPKSLVGLIISMTTTKA